MKVELENSITMRMQIIGVGIERKLQRIPVTMNYGSSIEMSINPDNYRGPLLRNLSTEAISEGRRTRS
jgi:hypothetical protein